MNYIQVDKENSTAIDLYYEDHGNGRPVVLIHGWPLSEKSWERQQAFLLAQGFRVISYARRGFGGSSRPSVGYDYDTLAADLNVILTKLDLRESTLVGFSMGAGEVARYLANYGTDRVSSAVFISGILPALLKTEDNPEGLDRSIFDEMIKKCIEDRPAFLTSFFKDFYNYSMLGAKNVSEEVLRLSWNIAAEASGIASVKCIDSWLEDFRSDVAKITIPSLIIHGNADKILPIKTTGYRLRDALSNCKFVEIEGGPHGIIVSHANEVNAALVNFIKTSTAQVVRPTELRH